MIEIYLAIYQRAHRILQIIQDLNNQTFKDFKLNIWNNSNSDILQILKNNISPDKFLLIDSSINLGHQVIYKMIPFTNGNPIIFIDDDLKLEKDFLEYNLKQFKIWGSNCILGWYTRIFNRDKYWINTSEAPIGSEVDYIGTAGMILDRNLFDKEYIFQNIPEKFRIVDDLFLSCIAKYIHQMKLIKIDKKCSLLVDGKDQSWGVDKNKLLIELKEWIKNEFKRTSY